MVLPRSSHCQCAGRGTCEHSLQQQLYSVGGWIGLDGNQFTTFTPEEQRVAFFRDPTFNQNTQAGDGRQVEGRRLSPAGPAGPAADSRPIERAQPNVNPFGSTEIRRVGPVQYPAGPPRQPERFAGPSSTSTYANQYKPLPTNPSVRPGQSITTARDIEDNINRLDTSNGPRAATGMSNNAVRNGTSYTPGHHLSMMQTTTTTTTVTTRFIRPSRSNDNDSEDGDNDDAENNYRRA